MPTVGNTANPTFGWVLTSSQNEMGEQFTMPSPGGLITNLHGYVGINSAGTASGFLCLWDSAGNLLADVPVTVSHGSQSAGGQAWVSGALSTPVFVASGATIYIGFWVPKADGMLFSTYSTVSTEYWNGSFATGGPGALGTTTTTHHDFGAYADYILAGGYVLRSGVWTAAEIEVERSGSMSANQGVLVYRSGVWTNAG